jgi:hypothetical protein
MDIKFITAGSLWLTPVILATQKAENRRIKVWHQPQANSFWTLSWKKLISHIQKGWQSGSSGKSTCLASVRLRIQTPMLLPTKKPQKPTNLIITIWVLILTHFTYGAWDTERLSNQLYDLEQVTVSKPQFKILVLNTPTTIPWCLSNEGINK